MCVSSNSRPFSASLSLHLSPPTNSRIHSLHVSKPPPLPFPPRPLSFSFPVSLSLSLARSALCLSAFPPCLPLHQPCDLRIAVIRLAPGAPITGTQGRSLAIVSLRYSHTHTHPSTRHASFSSQLPCRTHQATPALFFQLLLPDRKLIFHPLLTIAPFIRAFSPGRIAKPLFLFIPLFLAV